MNTDSRPSEESRIHTRILRFGLGCDASRAYWRAVDDPDDERTNIDAFRGQWFGQVSENRAKVIMRDMRARYDAYPAALRVLSRWCPSDLSVRKVICHWHLQLSDPLYRRFTGDYLVERRMRFNAETTRDHVARWVDEQQPDRWSQTTCLEFASKLLSAAYAADLIETNRDPRRLVYPRVPDEALSYGLHLFREVETTGSILENPYLRAVGLTEHFLEDRIRTLEGVELRKMGDLTDFDSRAANLSGWAEEMAS